MTPGLRKFKAASLRVAVPLGLPEDMHESVREIIDVQSTNPRKGHASHLMHNVCAEADVDWITLMVQVKAFDDGMDDDQLKKWYGKFGFEVIQVDPVTLMSRSPK